MYVVKISDGLGNQMFQYAFARKIQLISGKSVYLDTRFINNEDRPNRTGEKNIFIKKNDQRKFGLNHFKIHLPVADKKILSHWKFLNCKNEMDKIILWLSQNDMWWYQYLYEKQESKVDFLNQIHRSLPTYFEGYFFNLNFYNDIRDILQKDFILKKPIKISSKLKRVLDSDDTVSIHIRRGDFLKLNRDISQKNYYFDAIEMMQKYVKNPVWLIFSDDIEWVKNNFKISGEKVFISDMGYEDYEELIIMKNCKNHIIANSTFSYWAAYLNPDFDKKVICPKRWKTEIVPGDWIKI